MQHLQGQLLGIYEPYFSANKNTGRQITKEAVVNVPFAAIQNSLTTRELGWLGIGSAVASDGSVVAIITQRGDCQRFSDYYQTGTEELIQQFAIADGNPLVKSIVFKSSSFGGYADGSAAFAKAVKATKKPVVGFGVGAVASAAYEPWSQCKELYIESNVVGVGSIGCIMTYQNGAKMNAQDGIETVVIRSNEDKAPINWNEDFSSDAAKAEIAKAEKMVKEARAEMWALISKARPKMADPGAGIFWGKEALKAGLVDGIMSFEAVLKRAFVLGMA
jgi:ClpP class serine protease